MKGLKIAIDGNLRNNWDAYAKNLNAYDDNSDVIADNLNAYDGTSSAIKDDFLLPLFKKELENMAAAVSTLQQNYPVVKGIHRKMDLNNLYVKRYFIYHFVQNYVKPRVNHFVKNSDLKDLYEQVTLKEAHLHHTLFYKEIETIMVTFTPTG